MLPSLTKYKFMYLGIQVILLGIVFYKLTVMGLLPVSAADYVDMVPPFEVAMPKIRLLKSWLRRDLTFLICT